VPSGSSIKAVGLPVCLFAASATVLPHRRGKPRRLGSQSIGSLFLGTRVAGEWDAHIPAIERANRLKPQAPERNRHLESTWAYRSGREPPGLLRECLRQLGFFAVRKRAENVWSGADWSRNREIQPRASEGLAGLPGHVSNHVLGSVAGGPAAAWGSCGFGLAA